ncbi:hypothetical protein BGX21_003209 [Mortierella sp. AD011]|nr:hypothetical protein BGX20_003268 [Mortierella sp. AD010]KAF9400914.1 hypothetical protein BGX21_003209 [Mortierella sp. AD011]
MLRLISSRGQTIHTLARVTAPALQQSLNFSHRRLPAVARTFSPQNTNRFSSKSFSTTGPSLSSQASPPPSPPKPKKRSLIYRAGRALLIIVAIPVAGSLAYVAYDAVSYEVDELHRRPPRRVIGGPKNLVMTHGCEGSVLKAEEIHENDPRKRLVILGSGWGAVSVINQLDHKKFHVTVVSPTNYFLFTPLLPSATVGTLELRSLIEPVRRLLAKLGGYYLEARAEDIDFENQLVEVSGVNKSEGRKFYVPYDKLVIAVGSESMTHGVEGMEYCNFLKSITDARDIRRKLMENFEKASLPTTTDEERRQLLSFVICGGGPTGIEFAAELYDFLNEDLVGYFPAIPPEEVQVHIIQSAGHILNTYDLKISEMTEAKFRRENINVITGARVGKVNPTSVIYKDKATGKEVEIPFGICLWSTGVGMTPLVKTLVAKLPSSQSNKHAIETDAYMRVLGTPNETVYAIGDCATIPQPQFVGKVMEYIKEYDTNNDGTLSYDEFKNLADKIAAKHSILKVFLAQTDEVFEKYDMDHNGKLDFNEIQAFLRDAERSCTSLPATAQVANQQGKFVGKRINTIYDLKSAEEIEKLPPFKYTHLGSLAYIGNNDAVLDMGKGMVYSGLGSEYMWRSIYFTEQVSMRTRLLLLLDWSKRTVFGRDISKF